MQIAYDFHIHTAASPCGDLTMTPNNIVNMSLLKQLDAIAITDHQTVANCEAVMKVGKEKGLIVIPGIEIECMEEFHLVALFETMEQARQIEDLVKSTLPPLKNRKDLFGEQWILDENDEKVGEIEQLLLVATQISVDKIVECVKQVGGLIYPAHIDRSSYSILSNLGSIPSELLFSALEISQTANKPIFEEKYANYNIIQSSDAHYLMDIAERERMLEVDKMDVRSIFERINQR